MTRPLLAAVGFIVVAHSYAWAQGASAVQDIARAPTSKTSSEHWKKFEGSTVDLSTYIGSGTFYASGYSNPYASLAVFARPSYKLGTRYKLALRARIYARGGADVARHAERSPFLSLRPMGLVGRRQPEDVRAHRRSAIAGALRLDLAAVLREPLRQHVVRRRRRAQLQPGLRPSAR